ncbi:2-hydroxychromene-2-carboxylate isomerase [Pelomicrobium methylotrophicum]|uniref:2-hydroxychromene-2-carboxylate isomerase n=1 Tax=Pelomicrobium methylotrophicum TaxID=2602750 RepID=A0A5C7EME4_9PROT|nr:2-hydroxychromene-2-carboxylate isomerase [Pelomicrobium methylotrophicum]TXF12630.1 2-hydroxychromene-2-carboxylate isomerase [Pelomicrobium methylotrophicum]
MTAPIDFYFDFSSPYGYFGSCRIEALAAKYDREVVWRPILLGAVFKLTGGQPLPTIPLKSDYAHRDILRCARYYGIPFRIPSRFPVATQAPARAIYWVWDRDPPRAKALAAALLRAYFVDDRDISSPEVTAETAATVGIEREALLAALQEPAVKERLRTETDAAIARGVFGSPFFIVDDEPFWGADRMDQLEHWLKTGGW